MSKLFGNLTTEGAEEAQDRLGGRSLLPTGLYPGKIKVAYAGKSTTSDARSVTVVIKTDQGPEIRETFWITNGKGEPTYKTKDNKLAQLPGYASIEELCQVSVGKSITELDSEEKMVNIYDFDQKKEVPTSVPVLVDLVDAEVTVGLFKAIVNKQEKGQDGKYHDIADSRELNTMEKFFHTDTGMTYQEIKRELEKGEFIHLWDEKYSGHDQDRRSIKDGGSAGTKGAPPKPNEESGARRTLFGKK